MVNIYICIFNGFNYVYKKSGSEKRYVWVALRSLSIKGKQTGRNVVLMSDSAKMQIVPDILIMYKKWINTVPDQKSYLCNSNCTVCSSDLS